MILLEIILWRFAAQKYVLLKKHKNKNILTSNFWTVVHIFAKTDKRHFFSDYVHYSQHIARSEPETRFVKKSGIVHFQGNTNSCFTEEAKSILANQRYFHFEKEFCQSWQVIEDG